MNVLQPASSETVAAVSASLLSVSPFYFFILSEKQTKYVSNALVIAVVCFSKVIGELSVMVETCIHGFLDNNNNILY